MNKYVQRREAKARKRGTPSAQEKNERTAKLLSEQAGEHYPPKFKTQTTLESFSAARQSSRRSSASGRPLDKRLPYNAKQVCCRRWLPGRCSCLQYKDQLHESAQKLQVSEAGSIEPASQDYSEKHPISEGWDPEA